MCNRKIIIAGLPNAGKTTYIAALNGLISSNGFSLIKNGTSKEQQYLNTVSGEWLRYRKVKRSTDETPHFIDFPLKQKDSDVSFTIELPDVKGEMFEDIIQNDFDNELEKYCKDADGILYFINEMEDVVLKSELMEVVGESETGNSDHDGSKIAITPEKLTDMVRNILVLKYLRRVMGDVRLVVAVSSWDEEETRFSNIDEYFKKKCPALYNFIRFHFSDFKLYGVSAQGANYDKGIDGLDDKMDNNERSYVFDTERRNDLSLPLVYLIAE